MKKNKKHWRLLYMHMKQLARLYMLAFRQPSHIISAAFTSMSHFPSGSLQSGRCQRSGVAFSSHSWKKGTEQFLSKAWTDHYLIRSCIQEDCQKKHRANVVNHGKNIISNSILTLTLPKNMNFHCTYSQRVRHGWEWRQLCSGCPEAFVVLCLLFPRRSAASTSSGRG